MDSKLILIKAITLLYLEGRLINNKFKSKSMVSQVIDALKLPQQIDEADIGRNTIIGLKDTLLWMCEESEDTFDLNTLLQRVRLNVGDELDVYEAMAILDEYTNSEDDVIKEVCKGLRKEISSHISQNNVKEIISKAHRELFYNSRRIDWSKFTNTLVSDLEIYSPGMSKEHKKFMINLVSMSDPNSIKEVLEKAKEDTEGVGGFKTGWQAVNRMMGESETLRRGMFVLIGALTHNYKSGFCHDLFRHVCIHNTPQLDDPTKKPLILYFSTENRAEEDILRMYIALKENETGEAVNVNTIDPLEASVYISERLGERGFHTEMIRVDGGEFTMIELFNTVLDYEAEGYEVQAIFFDYLSLIDTSDLKTRGSMGGENIRLLMQRVRTFMSARNILFVTPHQLSQQAMDKKREGSLNFLREVAGKNYWDGSKRIANEADLEIFLDIVAYNNKHYLHVHRGKHRTVKATPRKNLEFYLPFSEVAYIPDDVEGEDRSTTNIQGNGVGEVIF